MKIIIRISDTFTRYTSLTHSTDDDGKEKWQGIDLPSVTALLDLDVYWTFHLAGSELWDVHTYVISWKEWGPWGPE